jgi:hypothetical protein
MKNPTCKDLRKSIPGHLDVLEKRIFKLMGIMRKKSNHKDWHRAFDLMKENYNNHLFLERTLVFLEINKIPY